MSFIIDIPKISECIRPIDLMRELGPSCCINQNNLTKALGELLPLNEDDIMDCLLYMAHNV